MPSTLASTWKIKFFNANAKIFPLQGLSEMSSAVREPFASEVLCLRLRFACFMQDTLSFPPNLHFLHNRSALLIIFFFCFLKSAAKFFLFQSSRNGQRQTKISALLLKLTKVTFPLHFQPPPLETLLNLSCPLSLIPISCKFKLKKFKIEK